MENLFHDRSGCTGGWLQASITTKWGKFAQQNGINKFIWSLPWITGMNFIINDLDFLIKRMELKIWKTLSVSCCHPRVTRVIDDLGHVFSAISQLFIIYTQCSCPLEYPLEDWQLSESEDRFSKWKVKHFHYMFTHFLLKGTFLSLVLSEVEVLF